MSSRLPAPRHTFRVPCEYSKSRLYFEVRIYNNAADLQRVAAVNGGHSLRRLAHTKGICQPFGIRRYPDKKERAAGQRARTQPICGRILFTHTYLNSMVIAHEVAHAAIAYAERRGFLVNEPGDGQFVGAGEERFCRVLGDMVGLIYWNLMKLGYATVINPAKRKTGRVFTQSH